MNYHDYGGVQNERCEIETWTITKTKLTKYTMTYGAAWSETKLTKDNDEKIQELLRLVDEELQLIVLWFSTSTHGTQGTTEPLLQTELIDESV